MMFDLVYTDKTHADQGVIGAYSLDAAWGADENDFELVLPAPSSHVEGVDADAVVATIDGGGVLAYPESIDRKAVSLVVDGSAERKVSRNLVSGSQDFSGSDWLKKNDWTEDANKYNGLTVLKRQQAWNGVRKDILVKAGKTYTFSAFVKIDDPAMGIYFYNANTGSSVLPFNITASHGSATSSGAVNLTGQIGTGWTRFWETFTAKADGYISPRFEVSSVVEGKYLYVCGYQLEESATVTDYEPYFAPYVDVVRGRNLLDTPAWKRFGITTTTGGLSVNGSRACSDVIEVPSTGTYTLSMAMTDIAGYNIVVYRADAPQTLDDSTYASFRDYFVRSQSPGAWITTPTQACNLNKGEKVLVVCRPSPDAAIPASKRDTWSSDHSVQFERGSVATPYVPYGALEVVTMGKNLLDSSWCTDRTHSSGTTTKRNSDGSVTVTGTSSNQVRFWNSEDKARAELEPGTYTLSEGLRVYFSGNSADYVSGTFTLSEKKSVYNASFVVQTGTDINKTYYPQLERGSTATAYEPYRHGTATIGLGSSVLASLPNGVRDVLRKDTERTYIEKRVGVVDLGTLTWDADTARKRFWAPVQGMKRFGTSESPNILCARYENRIWSEWLNTNLFGISAASDATNAYVSVRDPQITVDLNNFKAAMSGVLLYYELATPQEVMLEQTAMPTLFANGTLTLDATLETSKAVGYELSPASHSYVVHDVPSIDFGALVYVDGTQLGGVVDDKATDGTGDIATVTYHGRTWHGIMAYSVIQPDPGADYYTYSGDANDVIRALIARQGLGSIFECVGASGINVSGRFDRYTDMYGGILKMLTRDASRKAKLAIEKQPGGMCRLSAVPVGEYVSELDSDRYGFKATLDSRPVNHLICLGKGDLRERDVVHFYADASGNVSQTQTLFGIDERCMTYDSSNSEHDDLVKSGREKLEELQDTSSIEMTVTDGSFDVGDIVGALDNLTGIYVESAVSKVVASVGESGIAAYSYEVGEITTRRGSNVPANKL